MPVWLKVAILRRLNINDMRKFGFFWNVALVFFAISVLVVSGCNNDDDGDNDVPPNAAIFTGVITVEGNDVWREWQGRGDVEVNVFPEFSIDPPEGWGPVPDTAYGPDFIGGTFAVGLPVTSGIELDFSEGQTDFGYTFTLNNMEEPVTFSALAVAFVHDSIEDTQLRTCPLGVFWANPDSVSHGVVIKPGIGEDPIHDYPAPATFTIRPGEFLEIDFKADFSFVEEWYN